MYLLEKPSTHCPLSTVVSRDSNVTVSVLFLHLIYVIEGFLRFLGFYMGNFK